MKKRLLIISCTAVLVVALATMSFAANPVKLVVNGTEIKPDVPPQIINGRTMVPIRFIAELFGTEVDWDQENQTVSIYIKSARSTWFENVHLKGQVEELEKALAPRTPQEAVNTWAKGVKMSNNSLQKAVLSPEYREQGAGGNYNPLLENQQPGIWVEDFKIIKETEADNGSWEYEVKFEMANSSGSAGAYTLKVLARQYDQNWYISSQ